MSNPLTAEELGQLQRELNMLRDYSRALEGENKTRNQERVILEKQIERLTRSQQERQGKPAQAQCQECPRLKSDIIKLQNQIERLKRQNSNLQSSYNVLSETLTKLNTTATTASKVTTTSTSSNLVIRSGVVEIGGSNVTLGAGGGVGGDWENRFKELTGRYDVINGENLGLKRQLDDLSRRQPQTQDLQQKLSKLTSQNQSQTLKLSSLQLELHNLKSALSTKQNQLFTLKNRQLSSSSSTQLELKAVKESLAGKDKEINVLRQKLADLSAVEFEMRGLRAALGAKDGEIAGLREQLGKGEIDGTKVYKLQGEIRNMKYQVTSKDSEIQTLKNKIAELSSGEFSKSSALQLQLKSIKLTISAKDSQLSALRSQLSQLPTLRSQLSTLQTQSSTWQSRYQQQAQKLQAQPQPQPTPPTPNLSSTLSHYNDQITGLTSQLEKLKMENGEKDVYIRRVEDELKEMTRRDEEKNIEVRKLDSIVNSYVEKIGELQIELNRLEKNSLSGSFNPNSSGMSSNAPPPPPLPSQPSTNELILLEQNRTLNQKIRDQDRRILILEQTNRSLRQELRLSIQLRSRESSRIMMQPPVQVVTHDEELLGTIRLLKQELEEMRGLSTRLKSDNQYLQAKLSGAELEVQQLIGLSRTGGIRVTGDRSLGKGQGSSVDIAKTNKLLGGVPIVESKMSSSGSATWMGQSMPPPRKQIRVQQNYTILDDNERNPITSAITSTAPKPSPSQIRQQPKYSKIYDPPKQPPKQRPNKNSSKDYSQPQPIEVTNIGNASNPMPSMPSMPSMSMNNTVNVSKMSSTGGRGVDELQRKIQMLKMENQGLRKHLYQ